VLELSNASICQDKLRNGDRDTDRQTVGGWLLHIRQRVSERGRERKQGRGVKASFINGRKREGAHGVYS
jgi:hypothetical protein